MSTMRCAAHRCMLRTSDPKVTAVFQKWAEFLPYHAKDYAGLTWQNAADTLVQKKSGMYVLGMFVGQQFPKDQQDDLATWVEEAASGIRVIKALGRREHSAAHHSRLATTVYETQLRKARLRGTFWASLDLVPNVAIAAILLIGENFIQPALIGGAARLPFLLVLIGIFGGMQSFGMVGLFLGPVIMAALLTIWREWIGVGD